MHETVPYREISLVLLAVLALFALLSIGSYSPMDSAFSYTAQASAAQNLVGNMGAWFADLALTLFGWVAWLLPVMLGLVAWHIIRQRNEPPQWHQRAARTLGWSLFFAGGCALMQMHFVASEPLPAGTGGMIGQWLTDTGLPVLGVVGLTLLALAMAMVGAQAAAGFSWITVAERTGQWIHLISQLAVNGYDRAVDWWQVKVEARALARAARERERAEEARRLPPANPEPRIAPVEQKQPSSVAAKAVSPLIQQPAKPVKQKAQQKSLFRHSTADGLPEMDLLDDKLDSDAAGYSPESLEAMSRLLEIKLKDFNVDAEVVSVLPGPVVTRFEIQPAAGVKVQKITSLVKDLARSLAVISVRVVEVIPGKSVVGIEIPNEEREIVRLKELLASEPFQDAKSALTLALGKDIAGEPVLADISKMPHLLVAGTTGSGKSVGVNAMLLSILYKATPEDVRLILVDPKMLELSVYEGIPHLLTPVVTDMKEAAHALNWCVAEMERRYKLMASQGVRNLAGYNKHIRDAEKKGEPIMDPLVSDPELAEPLTTLPLIVVVIDEFADMMMIVGKKVEQLIARIAQKARAAGIHLVLATQRPSVDVITGLIKANIPTRMAFQVSSKVDSRTILDQGGAEQLLGHGDMLYLPPGTALPVRVHGAFVSDDEVHRVASDWKERGQPNYDPSVLTGGEDEPFVAIEEGAGGDTEQEDPLYDEAVNFVIESGRASISSVQRKLRIGYNRAARLIEAMEMAGVVSTMNSNGSREVLVPRRD